MVDGIQNMAEEAVVSYVNKVWSSNKYCQCDKCKRDVITYALNHVAPRYVDETVGFFRNYPFLVILASLNLASSNFLLQRPYIVLFSIFNLLFVPSTKPLLYL